MLVTRMTISTVVDRILSLLRRNGRTLVVAVVAITFAGGIIYSNMIGTEFRYDEPAYYNLATNLATLHMYTASGTYPTAFFPPGYPFLLSVFVFLGADIVALRIVNFVGLALSIILLHRLVRSIRGEVSGTAAAIMVLFYPVLIYTAGILYPQTIATTLLLLALVLIARSHVPSGRRAATAGITWGALILMVPAFVFSMLVAGAWMLLAFRKSALWPTFLMFVFAALVVGPWTVRNYKIFDSFVLVSTNGGVNLLLGNFEDATVSGRGTWIANYTDMTKGMYEAERDRFYRDKAIEWIQNNKMEAARLYVRKVLHYFNYRNEMSTESEMTNLRAIVMLCTYAPLLILFGFRLALLARIRPSKVELLLIALYLGNAFFLAIFYTRIRFRLPFDLLLIGVCSIFVVQLLGNMISNKQESERVPS